MHNYWLLKTEPDECSIDDIRRAGTQGISWDGIRNYQARNFIRDQLQPGDRCFIVHSSCPKPGVYGLALATSPAMIDPSQFQVDHPYFDAKATKEKPRWWYFQLAWQASYRPISNAWLKQQPECQDWLLFRQPRLSVSPISFKQGQWLEGIAAN